MTEPKFIKIDTDLIEGMKGRIERRHVQGESYAAMYAENWNSLAQFGEDVDQDNINVQRVMAFLFAVSAAIVDEYMTSNGWELDDQMESWEKKTPAVPELMEENL